MSIRQNPWVQDAASGKRRTPWWLAIIVFGVIFGVVIIGLQGLLSGLWETPDGSAIGQVKEGLLDLLPVLAVFAWLTWFERNRITTLGFHNPKRGVLALLLGIVIGAVMISVPVLILLAAGVYRSVTPPPDSSSGFSALPVVVGLALAFIIQGGQEEVVVRGFLFPRLALQMPAWLAVLIPALLFTLVHGVATAPVTFITIFLYAVFATFVALERKSLWLICGIHAGWNWALGNIWGLAVSGIPPESNALFFLEGAPGQPDWLTGGQWGPEGSIVANFMIITATILVFLAWRRADKTQTGSLPNQQIVTTV